MRMNLRSKQKALHLPLPWLCCVFLLLTLHADAQKPQYATILAPINHAAFDFRSGFTDTGYLKRAQMLYLPTEFAGSVPKGQIKNLYLRFVGVTEWDTPCVMQGLHLRLKNTQRSTWYGISATHQRDTFETDLTTVHSNLLFSRIFRWNIDTPGTWIKFPVNAGNFSYQGGNLILEFAWGEKGKVSSFIRLSANILQPISRIRSIWGRQDSTVAGYRESYNSFLDLGFDVQPLGLEEFHTIRAVGVFPNPAMGGKFNLSLEMEKPVGEVLLQVRNSVGQLVQEQRYSRPGNQFFQEVRLGDVPRGLYFLEVHADGDRIQRKVLVE